MSQPPFNQPDPSQPYGQSSYGHDQQSQQGQQGQQAQYGQQAQQGQYGQQGQQAQQGQQWQQSGQPYPSSQYGNSGYGNAAYPASAYGISSYGSVGSGAITSPGNLASWGQRVGAHLLDAVFALPAAVFYIIGFALIISGMPESRTTYSGATVPVPGSGNSSLVWMGFLCLLLGFVVMLALQVWNRWINGGKGQSWGKKKMGLWLVGAQTGQPVGTLMAFARDLAHALDSMLCNLGYLFPLWDEKRQTFADKICSTVVTTSGPEGSSTPGYGAGSSRFDSYGQGSYSSTSYAQPGYGEQGQTQPSHGQASQSHYDQQQYGQSQYGNGGQQYGQSQYGNGGQQGGQSQYGNGGQQGGQGQYGQYPGSAH